jgi:RNA polymerase sigma factor (sigma-70 family)
MHEALTDEELLERYGASDPEAASAFVRRFERRVFGLAYTIVGDPATAEEVAQSALLRAWTHAERFHRRRGGVLTWLLAITRNLAIDAVRVRRPVTVSPDEVLDLVGASTARGPSDVVVLRDDVARLGDALAGLPEEQRRAVVLSGIWGLTAREIAEQDSIPVGTAKTRIRAGLRRLRVAFSEDIDDTEAMEELCT